MYSLYLTALLSTATTAASEAPMNWVLKAFIISLVIGLLAGIIRALSLKGQLTSVYKNDSAADYTREKSFKVDVSRDTFLYSKTEKTEKEQQQAQNK